jgi:membrane-associated phospholipid phosphatase
VPGWLILLVGVGLTAAVFPFDARIHAWATSIKLGGDVRRELEAWQQFGGLVSVLVVAVLVWRLDGARVARLLDLAVAAVGTSLVILALKMLIGRPRPKFDDPGIVLGPFGSYPLGVDGSGRGIHHAWEFWAGISSDLWSMPSSHTSGAVALGVFLARMYPRISGLAWGLVGVVACARVLRDAHWPSDVVLGATVGLVVSRAAIDGMWGSRWTGKGAGRTATLAAQPER